MQVVVVISQHFRRNLKLDNFRLSGFKEYLLEAFQLFHRTGSAADEVTDIEYRTLITLDADYASPDLWDDIDLLFGYSCCMYSTHKHRPDSPRYRLIIPLSTPVGPEQYEAIARKLAEDIGIDYFDDTTYQPSRLMYWPSTSADGEYVYHCLDGPVLDPQCVLDRYPDWRDISFWPMSSRVQEIKKRAAKKQGDPLEKDGLIGAFCRTYDIRSAITTFLADINYISN